MPVDFAPMLVAIVLILTVGFVAVVRPIAKPLIRLLETMAKDRERPVEGLREIKGALEQIDSRLHLIEERQSFYEALRSGAELPSLPSPQTGDTREGVRAGVREGVRPDQAHPSD